MKVTIVDIAEDTGLSLSTVSKYLNHKNVLPENKEAIENSIRKLGYTPNRIAQSLRSKSSHTVAFLMPSSLDEFWGRMITHIETVLRKEGYKSIIYYYSMDSGQQVRLANTLLNNKVDGVIAISSYYFNQAFSILCDSEIPVILIDQVDHSLKADFITSDNYRGGYLAGRYLADHHHERIGFVAGLSYGYTIKERTRGFLDALKDAGVQSNPEYFSYQISSEEEGGKRTENLLRLPVPPTALCFFSRSLCIDGFQKIRELGIKMPGQLSVIGFDDDLIFPVIDPPLTVISQDFQIIGSQAATLLLERIRGNRDDFPARILTPVKLVERESVKFLR
ncbi:MAG: LacI family DNA-binding transcriptional regulator [Eubacteriales bacterium]|nr:LacI family DNA-binding transcriptional regulator [Eubacteriales bacterium]